MPISRYGPNTQLIRRSFAGDIQDILPIGIASDEAIGAHRIGRFIKILAQVPDGTWTLNDQGTQTFRGYLAYGNGYWVVATNGNGSNQVYYTTDPTGAWVPSTVGTNIINTVRFFNGYFYAIGGNNSVGSEIHRTADPSGGWPESFGSLGAGSLAWALHAMAWDGGDTIVAIGQHGDSIGCTMWVSTDGGDTWNENTGHGITTGASSAAQIHFDGTYWALTLGSRLWYTTNPAGSWTENTDATSQNNMLYYANGYWVNRSGNGQYRAGDPTGAFTAIPDTLSNLGTVRNQYDGYTYFENGYWVMVQTGSSRLYIRADDPTGQWTDVDGNGALTSVAYGGGYWVAADGNASGTIRHRATGSGAIASAEAFGSHILTQGAGPPAGSLVIPPKLRGYRALIMR